MTLGAGVGALAHQSCYYIVDPTNSGTPISTFTGDTISPCGYQTSPPPPVYDTCSTSPLKVSLNSIKQINVLRNTNGFAPLKISVGMIGGPSSAMRFIYNPSNPPTFFDLNASIGGNFCLRTPNIWDPSYVSGYYTALNNLTTAVQTSLGTGTTINMVKIGPGNIISDEFDTGGHSYAPMMVPMDSRTYLPTPAPSPITCSTTTSDAQSLLNGYIAQRVVASSPTYPDCRSYVTMSQANECVFGVIAGAVRGTLDKAGFTTSIEAIPTNNGMALPDVACGVAGAGEPTGAACVVQGASGSPSGANDQWAIYYLALYVHNLSVMNSVAQLAAKWGYQTVIQGATPPSFTSLITITWTGLQAAPSGGTTNFFNDPLNTTQNSINQVGCALNNTSGSNNTVYTLNTNPVTVSGIGTLLSWQTISPYLGHDDCTVAYSGSGGYTNETNYGPVLASGYASGTHSGGLFLEVQRDVAFNSFSGTPSFTGYLPQCAPDLAHAVHYLLTSALAPGICLY